MPHKEVRDILLIMSTMREQFNHHGPRVAVNAAKLAEAAGLSQPEIGLIAAGAQLHDIGKMLVRPDLLNKPGPLTPDERTEMETHVVMGWEIVHEAKYEKTIQDIIRHHHEKWNGTGYPDGLKGKDIPLAARIVSVCDIYQAMTDERIYRKPVTHKATKEYMNQIKETYLDPELVDLFFDKVATE